MKSSTWHFPAMLGLLISLAGRISPAAVEVEGWGDLRGFRIDGQLMPVTTSIRVVGLDPKDSAATGHWQQRDIGFTADGNTQTFTGKFGHLREKQFFLYKTTIQELDPNRVKIDVNVMPQQDTPLQGIYFIISAPLADYAGATADLIGATAPTTRSAEIATTQPATDRNYLQAPASGVSLKKPERTIDADFDISRDVLVRDVHDPRGDQVAVRILLNAGDVKTGQTVTGSFILKLTGQVDHQPAHVVLDPSKKGSEFRGIGGNFVFNLSSPDVNFNIDNFKPVWARMAVPLAMWQPDESVDPDPQKIAAVDTPGSDIRSSLELARKLSARGIPLIFTLWVPPPWAINNPVPGEPYAEGRIVNPAKWDDLCSSIVSYLLYAKDQYGVVPKLFSLNETDLGVTIKLTPQEYHDTIARLGACFAAHGIATKFLIGDVSNPRPVDFIAPATADPQVMQFAGAISYHSWNGATDEQLAAWHAAAQKAALPLFVAEGGTDSDAYRYPHVFAYTWYAIEEAATYLDTLACAQPMSILPWEMTSDYGMIDFSGSTPQPYKRFWCLKQLSATTTLGDVEIQATCDQPSIHTSALLNPAANSCCIHLANTGAEREVMINGIPSGIKLLKTYLTDENNNFHHQDPFAVTDGTVQLKLPPLCYLTLESTR